MYTMFLFTEDVPTIRKYMNMFNINGYKLDVDNKEITVFESVYPLPGMSKSIRFMTMSEARTLIRKYNSNGDPYTDRYEMMFPSHLVRDQIILLAAKEFVQVSESNYENYKMFKLNQVIGDD